MIYIEPYQLGWQPLVNCYMNTLPEKIPKAEKALESFLLSLVWSLGAILTEDYRLLFDKFLRDLLAGNDEMFPMPKCIKFSTRQCSLMLKPSLTIATSKKAQAAGRTGLDLSSKRVCRHSLIL